ncbi:MAG: TIGR02281 family clan AA aspartic protease [Hyphomicrobiales bacterium]
MRFYIGISILILAVLALMLMNNPGASLSLTNSDIARLASGLALLIVLGDGAVLAYRGQARTALRHAALWFFLALIVLTGYSYRRKLAGFGNRLLGELVPGLPVVSMAVESDGSGERTVTIHAADDGHFHLCAEVKGHSVDMLVDTGASTVSLTYEDAISVGIHPRRLFFSQTVDTANGPADPARYRVCG